MKLLGRTIIAALGLISLNTAAKGANQFNYFGIALQNNSYDNLNFAPKIETAQLSPLAYNDSSSETGNRVFSGYQFNRHIAVEVGLASFGKANFTVVEEQTNSTGKTIYTTIQEGNFQTLAADIRAVGTYPINDSFYLKAQVGLLAWDNEFSFLVDEDEGLAVQKTSDTGISLLTGFGIAYGFNSSVAISLDYENTKIAKITTQGLSVSLLMRF